MTDEDQTFIFTPRGDDGLPERLGSYNDFADAEDPSADFVPGLVSLAFLRAAIGRSKRFWCVTAAVGFLAGLGLYVSSPHNYQASTSILLTLGPYENVQMAAADNQAMSESRTVAGLAVRQLGLKQSPSGFAATYTVTAPTDRVLNITISALSGNEAMRRANAVATAFLRFRSDELRTSQRLVLQSLNQQISQIRQDIDSLTARISQLSAQPASSARDAQLTSLRAQRNQAGTTLTNLSQTVVGDRSNIEPGTVAAIKGSVILDAPTVLPHSRLKPLVLYSVVGLVAGLLVGLGLVVVRAIVSDRLRQRDDVAYALGAPVKLSVGTIRRKVLRRAGLASAEDTNIRRIVRHLDQAVSARFRSISALAVVPVDDLRVPASCLVSLAVSMAGQGKKVVLADLCGGAPAARLLGVSEQGIHLVSAQDAQLTVAVPERHDVAMAGPFGRGSPQLERSSFTDAVAAATASADVLLTLVTLDPAVGGEHLSTWATDSVAFVTAGRSSATKINAAGEMIRLSGTRLVSAVLVGADANDESLGTLDMMRAARDLGLADQGSRSGANGLVVAVDEARDKHRSATADPRNL